MKSFLLKISLYSIALIFINLWLGNYLKSYEYEDLKNDKSFFPALRWEEYYGLEDSIDVLIVGSSHACFGYDPQVITANLPANPKVYNFGSMAQSPTTSYFILEEILQKQRPKIVLFDIYHKAFTQTEQLRNGRLNFTPMQWGKTKRHFLKNGFSFREAIQLLLFPTYIYRKNLKYKIRKWLGLNYLRQNHYQYQGNGFSTRPDTVTRQELYEQNAFQNSAFDQTKINSKHVDFTKKAIDLCRTIGSTPLLMTAPIPQTTLAHIKDYKIANQYFINFAKAENCAYYDFNIQRIDDLKDDFHYNDCDHLNEVGTQLFSKAISQKLQPIYTQ